MEMVDRGNWVIFHKEEGYIQSMKLEEEVTMKTMMNTTKGVRASIARKGHNFIVEINIENEEARVEGGYMAPKKVATKRWNAGKKMEVDEGKTQVRNRYGALSVTEEDSSAFAGQEWEM